MAKYDVPVRQQNEKVKVSISSGMQHVGQCYKPFSQISFNSVIILTRCNSSSLDGVEMLVFRIETQFVLRVTYNRTVL